MKKKTKSIKYNDWVYENKFVVKVYNVENQSQLNIDQLNKSQNVAVRVMKNFLLKKENIV